MAAGVEDAVGQGGAAFDAQQRVFGAETPEAALLSRRARHAGHLPDPELGPDLLELVQAGDFTAAGADGVEVAAGGEIGVFAVRGNHRGAGDAARGAVAGEFLPGAGGKDVHNALVIAHQQAAFVQSGRGAGVVGELGAPDFIAADGVQGVNPALAGADVKQALGDDGRRVHGVGRLESPAGFAGKSIPGVDGVVGAAEVKVSVNEGGGGGNAAVGFALPALALVALVAQVEGKDAVGGTDVDVGALAHGLGGQGVGNLAMLPLNDALRRRRPLLHIAVVLQVLPRHRPVAGAAVDGELGLDIFEQDERVGRKGVVDPDDKDDEQGQDHGGQDAAEGEAAGEPVLAAALRPGGQPDDDHLALVAAAADMLLRHPAVGAIHHQVAVRGGGSGARSDAGGGAGAVSSGGRRRGVEFNADAGIIRNAVVDWGGGGPGGGAGGGERRFPFRRPFPCRGG